MRFERFKTFSDMLAFAVKVSAAYAPGSVELDVIAYSEESAKRPSILLCLPEGENISLRWYAFADEDGISFYSKRAAVEANQLGQTFAARIREALDEAGKTDLRRAPFEKLDGIPADICRTIARDEKGGSRTNYQAWVYASPAATDPIPAVGETVHCTVNRIGELKVTGYFREGGFVGIQGEALNPPEWFVKQNGADREVFIFPSEFRAIAATPAPAPATPAGWTEVEAGLEGTSLEKELNSNSPAIAPAPAALPGSAPAAALAPAPAEPAPAAALRHPGQPALTMLQGEAIACIWEAFLELYRGEECPAALSTMWDNAGTVHMRHIAISLSAMACDVWENMTEEQRESVIPYDWEFTPAFVKCIDWENDFDHIQLTYIGTKTVFDFIAAICPAN